MENVENRIRAIIANLLGIGQKDVKNDASFVDNLGVDSLHTVELMTAFEEEFSVNITDEEAEAITTVQMAIDYIEAHVSSDQS